VVGYMRHLFRVGHEIRREPHEAQADERNNDAADRNEENCLGECGDGLDENKTID
jgi:hypothetical protein